MHNSFYMGKNKMSKTTLILVALFGIAGFAVTWFTGFNPITSLYTLVTNPLSVIETLPNTLWQNWQTIAATIGTSITALTLATNKLSNAKDEAQSIENSLKAQVIDANQATAQLEWQVDGLKKTIENQSETLITKDTEITNLKQTVEQLEQHNRRLVEGQQYAKKLSTDDVRKIVRQETRKP